MSLRIAERVAGGEGGVGVNMLPETLRKLVAERGKKNVVLLAILVVVLVIAALMWFSRG